MARRLGWLPQARWKRWLLFLGIAGFLLVSLIITLAVTGFLLWRSPQVQGWVMMRVLGREVRQPGQFPSVPALSNAERALLSTNALDTRKAGELFQANKIWDIQLQFTSNQWAALGPNQVPPVF